MNPNHVILEAECHSHKDAVQLQSMLADLINDNDLAGEYIDQASIRYVTPEELKAKTTKFVDVYSVKRYNLEAELNEAFDRLEQLEMLA